MEPAKNIFHVTDLFEIHWYKVKDIGKYLDYQKASIDNAIQALVKNIYPEAVKTFSELVFSSDDQKRRRRIQACEPMINEKGVFLWFMSCRMPRAKPFKKWLCKNAGIYGKTPAIADYWSDKFVQKDIEEENKHFHTGFVYIATSEDYERKQYYIIRRSQKYDLRLNEMNSIMLEESMKLKPKLIWKSSTYEVHKSKLEEMFEEYRHEGFFKLNEEKLDKAIEFMAQTGARFYSEKDLQNEASGVLGEAGVEQIPDEVDGGGAPDPIPAIADEASVEPNLPEEGVTDVHEEANLTEGEFD
ncbi:hypothetical protein TSAR_013229 [Trichomalopsis sarcophagae]|uniref:Bro-N domain-containing protein n=1 Tax=Trichomalopsis sarcophagae TaxID=543379 RepID=A0A232FJK4_9HYME|nr:hypothetical protein TSAR_013229 [Trichomalopsis sarcophagae]